MKNKTQCTRREFIRSSTAAMAAAATIPYWFTGDHVRAADTASKNDRPNIGLIGAGERGMFVTKWAANFGHLVAVCDADLDHAAKAKEAFGDKTHVYQDYRRLLDRKDIDVVVNATPDHWHTAINIAACKSGRDVYGEKPLTLTIGEGKLLSKVVEQTGRVFQVGTMQRSERQFQTAVELVRNGRIGKLRQVWVVVPYFSTKGGPFPDKPVPSQLNWDLYQGQAPEHDYCPQRTHSVFRWWYEYAGGIITDWGNHHVDIAHWGMNCDLSGPRSVEARALFPNPRGSDYFNTPDRFFSRMRYANDVELLFCVSLKERLKFGQVGEHQKTPREKVEWLFGKDVPDELKTIKRNGIMFIGDKGRVFVNRGGVYGRPVEELKENPLPSNAWRVTSGLDHMANFFECVKSRKQPCAPVQVEHRTVTACHLTNISIWAKRKIVWDPVTQQIVGDDEANAMQTRPQRAPYLIVA
ncbi:MAG: Gfo/Idh/MocA family protein [Thermoguttaceae bacterium]